MELRLAWEPEASSRFQSGTRRPFNPFYADKSSSERRQPFFFQSFQRLTGCRKEKSIHPLEVARKTFGRDDGFDSIDCRSMAVASQAGALFAVKPLDRYIPVVNDV